LEPANKDEARLLGQLDARRLPEHVAVIMDGNGRWAQRRHLPRLAGHKAGVRAARNVIETSARLGIPALTLYAFSMENWRRPKTETDFLMRLLREYLRRELPVIHKNNIRMLVIGRPDELPAAVRSDVDRAVSLTAGNSGMKLAVALNYGGARNLLTRLIPFLMACATMASALSAWTKKWSPSTCIPPACPTPIC